ncbi:hypothetical protein FORC89_2867 [Salmonella sp. FORC89]|uniref:Uncharacterized protein n=3 Tax=Salmonella enterica I TaxID=59201 RepID=A0A8X6ES52_SALDU|nr:hypothetical protein SeD_A1212 [Salmonella enterica subsp. enterica serovar Dublin str. CT_02021853]AET54250.1 hypothetical protein SPUL_1921 [Salmonella enterica subsp. enterica serovar Gallinarum/Pullorum str. RKS5078]AGU64749.1 hypothetical protein SPUCDC_1907 [Salmonella enterica subsp. enterica serovar Gallinarum/Pullorum str. CDC1983-67]ATD45135.1 hypothetical protein FORC51_2920 [Salmonella enterica]AUC49853.1 Homoserine kinase [Salmonella enterica subsp. enterica serovar Typhimurium]
MLGYAPFHPTSGNDGFGSWKSEAHFGIKVCQSSDTFVQALF